MILTKRLVFVKHILNSEYLNSISYNFNLLRCGKYYQNQ